MWRGRKEEEMEDRALSTVVRFQWETLIKV